MIFPIFLDPWPEHWLIPRKSLFICGYTLLEEDDNELEKDLDELDARDEDDDEE